MATGIEREAKLSRIRSVEVLRIREHTKELKQRISPTRDQIHERPPLPGLPEQGLPPAQAPRHDTQQNFPTRYVAEKIIPADTRSG